MAEQQRPAAAPANAGNPVEGQKPAPAAPPKKMVDVMMHAADLSRGA